MIFQMEELVPFPQLLPTAGRAVNDLYHDVKSQYGLSRFQCERELDKNTFKSMWDSNGASNSVNWKESSYMYEKGELLIL